MNIFRIFIIILLANFFFSCENTKELDLSAGNSKYLTLKAVLETNNELSVQLYYNGYEKEELDKFKLTVIAIDSTPEVLNLKSFDDQKYSYSTSKIFNSPAKLVLELSNNSKRVASSDEVKIETAPTARISVDTVVQYSQFHSYKLNLFFADSIPTTRYYMARCRLSSYKNGVKSIEEVSLLNTPKMAVNRPVPTQGDLISFINKNEYKAPYLLYEDEAAEKKIYDLQSAFQISTTTADSAFLLVNYGFVSKPVFQFYKSQYSANGESALSLNFTNNYSSSSLFSNFSGIDGFFGYYSNSEYRIRLY